MKKSMSINIYLEGGKETCAFGEAAQFHFMPEGLFFIQEGDRVDVDQIGRIVRKKTVRNKRVWYPIDRIKKVEIDTKSELEGEDIKKYDTFLKHGIDITKTKISHTEPLSPAEIEKAILAAQKQKEALVEDSVPQKEEPKGGDQL